MLGVLKAGGAFVPLDPTHPTSRLQSLVRAVKAKIMLCSRDRIGDLSGVAEMIIPLDQATIDEISLPAEDIPQLPDVRGHNAAYVIFTSGSTGEPKVRYLRNFPQIHINGPRLGYHARAQSLCIRSRCPCWTAPYVFDFACLAVCSAHI